MRRARSEQLSHAAVDQAFADLELADSTRSPTLTE